jgi:transcription initiation factor TFIIB
MESEGKTGKESISTLPEKCPVCGGTQFVRSYERGEVSCVQCGAVLTEKIIDTGPEWRAFTPEEKMKRSRAGTPLISIAPEVGMSTVIEAPYKDAFGKSIDLKKRLEILRWRKWQIRSQAHSSMERNLTQAIADLERISNILGIPTNVKEEAVDTYRKAVEAGLVRGRSIESVIAASIYTACRKWKVPRTLEEIAKYTKAGRKDVSRCYRLLLRETGIRIPLSDPADFVERISETLKLSGIVQKRAAELIKKAKELRLTSGKDPAGMAAAAVYIAALLEGEKRTQREIAHAAQVTEVTVRNRYKELVTGLKLDIPLT